MTYAETIAYLYSSAPLFQQVGGAAYKEGLSNTILLDKHFGHPHTKYPTIHVAGTNGKGSCAHTIAAMLQRHGYKTGLYTSPHLTDFRERIRVDGKMVPEQYVTDFVEKERSFFEPLHPSFFEITTAMAFKYFADEGVGAAVIEVGLGGRLDCTNIIRPALSLITNISLDHTQFLGDTLVKIAVEKAGIIKKGVPVVVGETLAETRPVFERKAAETDAPITFAEDCPEVLSSRLSDTGLRIFHTRSYGEIEGELSGECQEKNANTLLCAAHILKEIFNIDNTDVKYAFRHVAESTGLMGRWQTLREHPRVICDTGHNAGGWQYLAHQLREAVKDYRRVHIVFGMAADKDVNAVIALLPHEAVYYWTHASVRRAMDEHDISAIATRHSLRGKCFHTVPAACQAALAAASPDDLIYVGGSSFVVADLLSHQDTVENGGTGH